MQGSHLPHKILTKQSAFSIIPYESPEAIAAGYVATDVAQVYGGPTLDKDHYYYPTYAGNLFFGTYKNGLIVCRRKKDNSLVWVANVQSFNLDTGNNMVGPSRMIVRGKLAIQGDRLYGVSGATSNIGAQLFCIDKRTGAKIYSIAYDPPAEVRAALGVNFITSVGDYSAYVGSNAQVGDLFPVAKDGLIYVGVSSLQNFLNPGLIPTSNNYTGYPYFTDRGSLTVIKEFFTSAVVQAQTYAAVRPILPGEILSKNDPELDPFLPGTNTVLIKTLAPTGSPITSPGEVAGNFYFAQRIDKTVAPVTAANLAPFWSTVGATITVTNIGTSAATPNLTLSGALAVVNALPGSYLLSYVTGDPSFVVGTISSGDFAVWYVKQLRERETVENKYDANGLGYWGYSVWGSQSLVQCGSVTFGSGQAHAEPLSEQVLFSDPRLNYRDLKEHLVDLSVQYAATLPRDPAILHQLNQAKLVFEKRIRDLVTLPDLRSPRGNRSYVDAIIRSDSETGEILFAVRSIPNDVYTFLGFQDPIAIIPLARQDVDGDLSSSVFQNGEQLSAASKNGGLLTLDLTHWKRSCCYKWDPDSSPCHAGINVEPIVYTGPNSTIGGTNYVSTYRIDSDDNLHLLALSANISYNGGSMGTGGTGFEQMVTTDGKYIPSTSSFAYSYSQDGRKVEWNTELLSNGYGNVTAIDDLLLCNDVAGHLYVIDAKNGKILETINSGTDAQPMNGGVASPAYDPHTHQVFWIDSYDFPGQPTTAGKWGWALKLKERGHC